MGMKIRTAKYIAKEGFVNVYRNKLMSLASVSIVIASLLIFGIFFVIVYNVSYNTEKMRQQPHIIVFCNDNLEDFEVKTIGEEVRKIEGIKSCQLTSRDEAFANIVKSFGEDKDVFEGIESDILRQSYIIELENIEDSDRIIKEIKENIYGVYKINYSQKSLDLMTSVGKWMKVASVFLIAVLFIVSVFIISNTIKLTVYARRKEINIMKYIGATDWFIRWPFVVEGIIIGVIGALAAFILTSYGYRSVESSINMQLAQMGNEFIELVGMSYMSMRLILFYSILGMVVGALGSIISMRRYLKV